TFVSLPPSEVLCDPLSDFNVWTSTRPLNSSAKGHAANESVVIAAARLDGRSFFWEQAPAAEGTVSGIITLLAAIQALYPVTQEAPPPRNIFFTFFQGVGLHSGRSLWMHSDPVSRKNDSVNEAVSEMMNRMESAAAGLSVSVGHPSFSQPLPPSSLQRFLRAGPIPGLVLADHQKSFSNRYYESMYDDAENLNVTYPPGLTPDEQLVYETDAAKVCPGPPQFYIGLGPRVHGPAHSVTRFVQYILANLTGTVTNLTESQCQNPSELSTENKDVSRPPSL
ncbi:hypothetical protein cypCar_00047797, partial [Cyprinus carpio]